MSSRGLLVQLARLLVQWLGVNCWAEREGERESAPEIRSGINVGMLELATLARSVVVFLRSVLLCESRLRLGLYALLYA